MTIVEEDEAKITKAIVEMLSRGSIRTSTYKGIPGDEFIESLIPPDLSNNIAGAYNANRHLGFA